MQLFKLTTAASLLAIVIANPIPHTSSEVASTEYNSGSVDKRANGEGVHLVNCATNGRDIYSVVVVCLYAPSLLFRTSSIHQTSTNHNQSTAPTTITVTTDLAVKIPAFHTAVSRPGRMVEAAASLQALLSLGTFMHQTAIRCQSELL